jgi:hypothetical protein
LAGAHPDAGGDRGRLAADWKESPSAAAIISLISGAVTALLMNRERVRVHDGSGLISAHLTGWYWLSLIATVALMISVLALLFRPRLKKPG